ncbi:hypothetical protein [Nocardioides alcanivorans]|uniref:hypothetical protein n=1 Tax=Nocardioides alcanivorans TaxID=2897352 RepID=UPI001F46D7FD|nr:hypothetical protein [Nocardioides alcanivorans]
MTEVAHVRIVEVAPRDGLQNEAVRLTVDQKHQLVEHAVAYGARNIEVTSFVHPKAVPAMADAEELVALLESEPDVTFSALVLNERGLDRALAAGITEVNAVLHCTDTFSQRNQGTDIDGGIGIWHRIAQSARAAGIRANLTLAVTFGCPFEGEVAEERVRRILERALEEAPAELSLADTIGVAVPRDVRRRFGIAAELAPAGTELRAHFHNTRNAGVANSLAAVEEGWPSSTPASAASGDARLLRRRPATWPPRTSPMRWSAAASVMTSTPTVCRSRASGCRSSWAGSCRRWCCRPVVSPPAPCRPDDPPTDRTDRPRPAPRALGRPLKEKTCPRTSP